MCRVSRFSPTRLNWATLIGMGTMFPSVLARPWSVTPLLVWHSVRPDPVDEIMLYVEINQLMRCGIKRRNADVVQAVVVPVWRR